MSNGKIYNEGSARWYYPDGRPCYEIAKKKDGGVRAPTLADARKLGLLPSVTSILRILDKPNLNDWKAMQVAHAIMTTPQKQGEDLDAFFQRVIVEERVHEEEAAKARDIGAAIHDAIEKALTGKEYPEDLKPFVEPVVHWQQGVGLVQWTEKNLVGDGFAGRGDALLSNDDLHTLIVTDFKTTGKPPEKDSWPEHKLQTAAYASTVGNTNGYRILTCNVYISTKTPGLIVPHMQMNWLETYEQGFRPLLLVWQWLNRYTPEVKP